MRILLDKFEAIKANWCSCNYWNELISGIADYYGVRGKSFKLTFANALLEIVGLVRTAIPSKPL